MSSLPRALIDVLLSLAYKSMVPAQGPSVRRVFLQCGTYPVVRVRVRCALLPVFNRALCPPPHPFVRPWGGSGGKSFRVTLLIQSPLTLPPVVKSGPTVTLCGTAGPLPTSLHPHVDRLTRPFILHRVACKDTETDSRGDGLTPAFVGVCAGEAFAYAGHRWHGTCAIFVGSSSMAADSYLVTVPGGERPWGR